MDDSNRPGDSSTTPTVASPPPPPRSRPPLRRPRQGRILTGVAAGVADHLGVDVAVVRIVIVVGAVLTQGLVVLAYLAATLFVPAGDEPNATSVATEAIPAGRNPLFWVGVGSLVIGALWLLGGPLAPGRLFPGMGADAVWAVVLIGFGLALWRAGEDRTAARHAHPDDFSRPRTYGASASYPSDGTGQDLYDDSETTRLPHEPDLPVSASPSDLPPPPAPPTMPGFDSSPGWSPPAVAERQSSVLTRITLGIALLVAGILWSLHMADVLEAGFGHIAAASLGVLGVGLLVGSVAGRGRWLILVGALLVPVVIAAELLRPFGFVAMSSFDGRGPAAEVVERPLTATELRSEYQLGTGTFELDLRELDLRDPMGVQDPRSRVELGAGALTVLLPDDVTADVTARVGIGEIDLDGRGAGGFDLQRSQTVVVGDGTGSIELDLAVGLGEVDVRTPPS